MWEWEAWMWGGGLSLNATTGTTDIQTHFANVIGQAATDAFTQRVYTQLVPESDIEEIAALGLDVVRVPLSRKVFEDTAAAVQLFASSQVSGWSLWAWKIWGTQSWHLYSATTPSPNWQAVMAWEHSSPAWSAAAPSSQQLNDGIDELFAAETLSACTRNDSIAAAVAGP